MFPRHSFFTPWLLSKCFRGNARRNLTLAQNIKLSWNGNGQDQNYWGQIIHQKARRPESPPSTPSARTLCPRPPPHSSGAVSCARLHSADTSAGASGWGRGSSTPRPADQCTEPSRGSEARAVLERRVWHSSRHAEKTGCMTNLPGFVLTTARGCPSPSPEFGGLAEHWGRYSHSEVRLHGCQHGGFCHNPAM